MMFIIALILLVLLLATVSINRYLSHQGDTYTYTLEGVLRVLPGDEEQI